MSEETAVCGDCGEPVVFDPLTEDEQLFNAGGGPLIKPWRHVDAGTRTCFPPCAVCQRRPAIWAIGSTVADGGGGTRFQVREHRCGEHRGSGILRF